MSFRDWPLTFKIAVPFLCLLGALMIFAFVKQMLEGDDNWANRKLYIDDTRAVFEHPSDLQMEGEDGRGLLMLDRDCTTDRAMRYARDQTVRDVGFLWVRCGDGKPVKVQ